MNILNAALQTILNEEEMYHSHCTIELITLFACEESSDDKGCVKAHGYIIATLFTMVRQSFGPLPISGQPISLHHVRASSGIRCTARTDVP